MEEKLTIKEEQIFRLLHEIRKVMKAGTIHITWHEHDFVNAEIEKLGLTGDKGEEVNNFKLILSTIFGGIDKN